MKPNSTISDNIGTCGCQPFLYPLSVTLLRRRRLSNSILHAFYGREVNAHQNFCIPYSSVYNFPNPLKIALALNKMSTTPKVPLFGMDEAEVPSLSTWRLEIPASITLPSAPSIWAVGALLLIPLLVLLRLFRRRQRLLDNVPIIGMDEGCSISELRNRFRLSSKEILLEGYHKVASRLAMGNNYS